MIPQLGFPVSKLFRTARSFTLEPLRKLGPAALLVRGIEGIESISLRRLALQFGGPENERVVMEADGDLFSAMSRRGNAIPSGPIIIRADCVIRSAGAEPIRRLAFVPPDTVVLEHLGDEPRAVELLEKGGFHEARQ